MSRPKITLSKKPDYTHLMSIGFFGRIVPKTLIDAVLEKLGRTSKRVRLLPASAVVYFVMAMSLFREPPQEEIVRIFLESLSTLSRKSGSAFATPCPAAISQARSRLGSEPMRLIADEALKPIAPPDLAVAWYRGMRLMSIDGSSFDTPDEAPNAAFFGYQSVSRGEPAYPQARVVAFIETGTRVITAAEIGPYRTSEQALSTSLIERGKLSADMLLLADRNFVGYPLWSKAVATGAKLLWRAKVGLRYPVLENLPDGSYYSEMRNSQDKNAPRHKVRIIEYALRDEASAPGGEPPGKELYRLVTNLLDYELAPAQELAALYHERWEIETVFGEFKTSLHGGFPVLRSKTPELVLQELWGLFLVHYCLRVIMHESAWEVGLDPDKLSFKKCVYIMRRKLPQIAASPPRGD